MRRPTVHDIARVSGFSLATVDRVLNHRSGVRPATVEAVQKVVQDIGYVRDISAANLASGRVYRIAFILPEGDSSFLHSLCTEVEQRARAGLSERLAITLERVPPFDGAALSEALRKHSAETTNSVVIVGTDHPEISLEIERLAGEGVPTLTLISDLPGSGRKHYIGIANTMAGRAAASLLGRFTAGESRAKIAVLAGSLRLRDHQDRLRGFEAVLSNEFPSSAVVAVLEGQDDEKRAAGLLGECLKQHPDLAGIYSLGAGTRGVVAALLSTSARPKVIAHELTGTARTALREGMFDAVIHQSTRREVDACIRLSRSLIDGTPVDPLDAEIRTEIFLRDTIPPLIETESKL
ncbi:LacI family DNA-binding transcriptional regulator [Algicella marina]|uniref:Substrate-binding domain-containing protein n=1 Tax=Algicella marina TaxID=2683284 RepID=A0A6P1T2L3_9RHOB|nr:LacI family DNA-binding transcriptional regulator [Algicella marina]QHQ36030.1 substrate-binding domain-containing protein [Algicella marina]